jgi:hypothetical protein
MAQIEIPKEMREQRENGPAIGSQQCWACSVTVLSVQVLVQWFSVKHIGGHE